VLSFCQGKFPFPKVYILACFNLAVKDRHADSSRTKADGIRIESRRRLFPVKSLLKVILRCVEGLIYSIDLDIDDISSGVLSADW
jgi:hypothetical protein